YNGVNRWDGYGFARWYANPDDSTTVLAHEIEDIVADKKENIWLVTSGGICRMNTVTHKVSRFQSRDTIPPAFRIYDNSHLSFADGYGDANPYGGAAAGRAHITGPG